MTTPSRPADESIHDMKPVVWGLDPHRRYSGAGCDWYAGEFVSENVALTAIDGIITAREAPDSPDRPFIPYIVVTDETNGTGPNLERVIDLAQRGQNHGIHFMTWKKWREQHTSDAEQPPLPTQQERRSRRDDLLRLLTRGARHGLTAEEAAKVRKAVEEELSDAEKAHARVTTLEHVARGNLRHVQLLVRELQHAESTLQGVREAGSHGEVLAAVTNHDHRASAAATGLGERQHLRRRAETEVDVLLALAEVRQLLSEATEAGELTRTEASLLSSHINRLSEAAQPGP